MKNFLANLKKFFTKKRIIILAAIVVLILLLIFAAKSCGSDEEETVTAQDVAVERRSITTTVEGSATLQAKDQYEITAIVTGDVVAAPFEEGDIVEKGDLLYQIDSSDIEKNIESAQLGLEKAQDSYNSANKSVGDLNVKSKESGTVKTVNVSVGDSVQAGMAVAECYNDSVMQIRVPFNSADAARIGYGNTATLTMMSGSIVTGNVVGVDSANTALAGNMIVRYVTINVNNPGAIKPGDRATAEINGISCNDSGEFKYISEFKITSEVSGEVASLNIHEGSRVSSGTVAVVLTSDSVTSNANNARLSLRDAQLSLERSQEQFDDYNITAPISGTVVTKNTKVGDKVDNTRQDSEPMALIYDLTSLEFALDVDETEIGLVQVGQSVTVTADAVQGSFIGYVEKVGVDGTSSNGVTSYPVTVRLEEYGDLLPGMNIDAVIEVSSADNVLAVPIEAVQRRRQVYVKGDKTDENDTAPDGYKTVQVETGASDDRYIEIVSGLKEGDMVRVATTNTNNTTLTPETEMEDIRGAAGERQGGGPGGASGGRPGGGRPGGF